MSDRRVFLFDLDGTLIDAFPAHLRVYRAVFSDLSLPFDETFYAEAYSPNWYLMYERMGVPKDRWPHADRLWLEHYERERPEERAGASALLHHIGAMERSLGLVTSGDRIRVERDLERLGWPDLFAVVVCGGEVPERKPHPAALQHALRRLGEEAPSAVYVGDTIEDVQMGKAAGVMTVAVPGGFSPRETLQRAGPDLIVKSLGELATLL